MLPLSSQSLLFVKSAALLFIGMTTNAFADIQQSITLPLTFGYDSNLRLSSSNNQAVNRIIFVPDYSITSNQGANEWFAKASLRLERSSKQTVSQNRTDPSLNLGWTHSYETGQFAATALMDRQSTRVTEFIDSGLVGNDNSRNTRSFTLNWLNNLSERAELALSGVVTNVVFDGIVRTGLIDYRNETVNTKLSYELSEQTQVFTQLSFTRYKQKELTNINSEIKNMDIGATWTVSEQFKMTTSVGVNEVKNKNNTQVTSNAQSWQAMFNMDYSTLRTNTRLNMSRSQLPSSTGSINETNQLTASWTYSLSDNENILLDLRQIETLTLNKSTTKSIAVNYIRQLSLFWDLRLSAEHRVRNDKQTNISSRNNSIMASIIYKLPDF